MEDSNILLKMAEEKQRKIRAAMVSFLGYEPSEINRKYFRVMHRLGESSVYYQDLLIATIKNEVVDDTLYA
jgi:hypothetical protein